jgi:hypothetical protein
LGPLAVAGLAAALCAKLAGAVRHEASGLRTARVEVEQARSLVRQGRRLSVPPTAFPHGSR